MIYKASKHSAKHTGNFVFSQLIPYIGNKRKLLGLIRRAIEGSKLDPAQSTFLDCFSGSGVVSRFAKKMGFSTIANDWEPYAEALATCSIECDEAPVFFGGTPYDEVIAHLNALPPRADWITQHLCPDDDVNFDIARDRMFYMRKNGMRLDAIRQQIFQWEAEGQLNRVQKAALVAPLLYQACWLSNTSGVFKGFHNGWGGQTGTALYRIAAACELEPAIFFHNGRRNRAMRKDAAHLAEQGQAVDFAYLDPPYNQHPYGSNYHVLNSIALWDKPALPRKITGHGDKSAIRRDWRTLRRSAYNDRRLATEAYEELVSALPARWVCTSYSTDGYIPLLRMLEANVNRGSLAVFLQSYKRYRVSSQRMSAKPLNVEFVLLLDREGRSTRSAESFAQEILQAEHSAIDAHLEIAALDAQAALCF